MKNLKTYQLQFKQKLPRHSLAQVMVGGQCCYEVSSNLLTIETSDVLVEVQLSDANVRELISELKAILGVTIVDS